MPPKKLPLYCLVHGDQEISLFGIKYDKNTTFDEFKDAILVKKKNTFANIDSPDLMLYQVNIDLTTQNAQRTALGNRNADIVNDLGGQVLSPVDNVEEKFPEPANKHIHIIIDVPTVAPVVARRNDDVIIARLDKIDKNVEDIKKEKSSVHISGVTEGYWAKIQEFAGLDYQATTREQAFPDLDLKLINETINVFGWGDPIERSQSDSTNADILPIRLSGTTDLVIVDRHSITSQAQEKHIRILFELKKVVQKKHTFQAMAELISADLKSIHPVLAVLTDLRDDWRFFWIDGKIIMRLSLPRADSVALIRHNLASANEELRESMDPAPSSERPPASQGGSQMEIESKSSEEGPLPKRQKLRHVVATSNVSSDIAPMEDFFDTMSEEEIFRYKTKQILTRFFSQPVFNGLNDPSAI